MVDTLSQVSVVGHNALVGMGQIGVIQGNQLSKAVVGSCIGLSLYDPVSKFGLLGHIVLPESHGKVGSPGKFADLAIPVMLEMAAKNGAKPGRLIAKIAGGANMFNKSGPIQIGDSNIKAVTRILQEFKIAISGSCVGGTKGRRIEFESETGKFQVGVVGQDSVTL